jgi:hypothetical protein
MLIGGNGLGAPTFRPRTRALAQVSRCYTVEERAVEREREKTHTPGLLLAAVVGMLCAAAALAEPTVRETTVIGPWTGAQAPLHPDNLAPHRISYRGTDLGWTYEHKGELKILFGDTAADAGETPIEASSGGRFDDAFGSVDLSAWNRPETFRRDNIPVIRLGQNPDSLEAAAINPGKPLELFKTPVGGFSNGEDEFGVFFTYKPQGCATDSDCRNGASCDVSMGYIGPHYTDEAGLTWGCAEGTSPFCIADTMRDEAGQPVPDSGLCNVPESTIWADSPVGRVASVSVELLIGRRDRETPKRYRTEHVWQTNKFMNPAFRTVQAFEPPATAPAGFRNDFTPVRTPGPHSRVFIWGRPHFVGVNATGRYLGQYFAYVDLPTADRLDWTPNYFAGLDGNGLPRFSPHEKDAVPLDQDSTRSGVQPRNVYDIVDQVSVAWVPQLSRWIEFYGGGMVSRPLPPLLLNCGVLELFTGPECKQVQIGNGALRMRSAPAPWGPWSPPQDLLAAGDPAVPEAQYGPGGMLYHPQCGGPDCAPHTGPAANTDKEYGFFYAANIIEQWIRPAGDGVDIIWNASTWDPYRVILLRTRVE